MQMQTQQNETALIFQEKLKTLYQSQDKIAPLIEGLDEIPQQSMRDYYVKLQIIVKEDDEKKYGKYEDISGKKKEVEPQKIFENFSTSDNKSTQKQASRILILGGAGVGKSTLMQYMTYKWSIGEMWKEANFDYVYRVTLKTLLNAEWKSKPWPYYQNGLPQSVLKCLVHYNLTKNFKTLKERNELKPEDIPWTTDERTLLLLDGYDEIAHLADEDPDYDIIMEEIFEHKRVIFTSRPNAINPRMKERFDRIVENTGLDDSGIEQYFRQYFKNNNHEQKGRELDRFLSSNSVIKDICKIPVNIAMLCYIWSSSDSELDSTDKLNQISSVSDLYQEVVHRLTQRFYAHKKWRGAKVEGIKLNDKLNNGFLDLDELKVLTHVAYKGMTGGGIDVESKNRVETLIIKGAQDKEGKKDLKDEVGISIQSSINYLSKRHLIQHDLKEKVDINNVYRFGLLKTEGATVSYSSSSKGNEKEPEETDLHKQNYSFIHLTFQEYLTACYLKDLIKNGGDQDKNAVCQYIAEHRNEPRYLMTMKFMAGAITADQEQTSPTNNEFAVMFWDSMICNVDGVIELGGETKISLLMHLLGQAKVKGELDSRIPHKEDIINLIDFVVLDDLVNWSTQLKESDYMSDTIKEGLIKAIVEGTLKWHEGQKNEISKKFSSALKNAIDKLMKNKTGVQDDGGLSKSTNILARGLEMGNDLIAKLTPDDRLRIVKKLKEIILKHEDQEWQLVLQAGEGVIKMNSQGSLSQEDVRELISGLVPLLVNKNLGQKSRETICAIMRKVDEPQIKLEAMDKIWKVWLETKAEVVTHTIFGVIKAGVLNKEIFEKARQQITYILLKSPQGSIAIDFAIELSAIIGEKSILGHLYDEIDKIIFNPFPKEKKDPMQFIPKLARARAVDDDRIAKTLEQIITLGVKGSMEVIYIAFNATIDLIDFVEAKKLSEMLEKQLTEFLNQSDSVTKKKAIEFTVMLAKKRKLGEPLVTKIVQKIMSKSADENENISLLTVAAIMELAKNVVNDNQLLFGLDELVTKFFSSPSLQIRQQAVMIIAELAKTRSMKKEAIQKVAPLVIGLIDNDKIADIVIDKTVILADIAEDKQIIHNLHEAIHKLFDKADNKRKEYAIKCIVRLAKTGKVEKEILAKSIQQVIDLILDDSEIRDYAIDTIKDFDDILHDKQIVHQAYQQVAKLFSESKEDRKDAAIRSAVTLARQIKVDDQILAQIIQQIINLLSDDSVKIRESVIQAITELISIIKDQKMLETLYEPVCKAFSDSEQAIRQSAIHLGFKLVTTGTADNEISIKVLQQIGSLLADKYIVVRLTALRATITLTSKIDNKKLLDNLNDSEAIIKLLDDPFWDIKITAIEHAIQLVKTGRASKEILAKTIQRVSNLINDNSGRYGPLSKVLMMPTVVEIIEDQETLHNFNDSFAKFFKHPEPDIREHAIRYAVSLAKVRRVDNKEVLTKTIQLLINLFLDRSMSVTRAAMQAIVEIAGGVEDKEILHNLYASVTNLFDESDTNKKRYAIELIEKLATAERSDKQALVEAVKRVIDLIADNDFAISRYAVNAVTQLGTIEEYKQTIQNISLTQITELSTHLEGGVRQGSIQLALTIAKSGVSQKELLDKLIQQVVNLVDDTSSSYDVGEFAVNAIMDLANYTVENLLLNVSDFTRYLKHPNQSLRTEILGFLSRSLQQALKKFSVIDKLLKNHQDLPDVQVISDQLFDNKMDQIARKEIDTILSALKRGDVSITMATLKDALLSRINWSGHSKFYELIETALMVIGFEQAKELASSEKELREVAQKILNCQVSNLNGEGIKWINDRFHVLSNLSQESKFFFKNLYHTLLKDSHISATEEELIIKFVSQGFTTSITRTAKIRFEAKEYSVVSSTNELHLENLARSVINQEKDILAFQYKDHHPLFAKMSRSSSGMKKAAIDIESVFSIVDKSQPLSADAWFLTKLQGEKDGKMIELVLLEQRSVIGDNLVYLLNKKHLMREHPENISKRLTDIFGVYSPARKFKGESKILELNEGNEIISGTRTLDLNQIKFDKPKDYFHQELLDLGNTDRLNYISSELSTKLTNYNEILNRMLDAIKPALSPENKTSIQEYCQAFIRTFAMVYGASQTIADGRVVLDIGDMKTTILSTLVSFIPVYGDTISSAVTTLGEFLKSREIQQNARKMVNLQPDAVGLNQLIGEVASKIISNPAKRQQIYDITEEELLRLSGTLWEKFNKVLSILQEKVDSFIYGQQYQTAAAKLGNKDANTLIAHWMKDKINPASVQEEFVKHALSGLKAIPSQAPSPVKAPEENTRPKTNCCQLFAVSQIIYDNPLLNQQEFLQKFASNYGIKSLNSLIDISRKNEL